MLENNFIILSGILELLISVTFSTIMLIIAINFIRKI